MSDVLKLLPCPFCGGEASAGGHVRYSPTNEATWTDGTNVDEAFFVNCIKCGVTNMGIIGHRTPEDAAIQWNTRKEPTPWK
jgi:hypothetical protein